MYPLLLRLCFVLLFFAGSQLRALATHALGGDIDYAYIPGSAWQYRVTVRIYSSPPSMGVPDPTQLYLHATVNGCANNAANFTQVVTRLQTANRSLGCVGGRQYQISFFETVVTLPPGQWTLRTNEENRSMNILNIRTSSGASLAFTAFLDNSSGLTNNSPRFISMTLPYACSSQPYRHSFSAFEPDGDSLVYTSVQPEGALNAAQNCYTPILYNPYVGGQFQDPLNGQTATYPAGQYSAAFPLLSFRALNGVAVSQFDLNAATGDLLTTPVAQVGLNTVAVRVDEYRRLNGTWTRIGSVTRDVVYSVSNTGGNRNPSFTSLQVAGVPQPLDQTILVEQGQSVSLTLTASDPDAGQSVRLISDVAATVPGASFQTAGNNQGVLTWQVPATLPPGRYSLNATVADSNCPENGSEVCTFTFLIRARALGTRSGRAQELSAYPMPFHSKVQFQLPTAGTQPVTITDGLGRVVTTLMSRPDGAVEWLPAADVATGTYFARPADGKYVFRLLRQ